MARMWIITPFGAMDFGGDFVSFFEPEKTIGITEVSNGYLCISVLE
jgi:hypothetical protein